MDPKHAVLLMAYGGPDSLEDIEPYLLDVRGGRATSQELVEEIRARYARIGGKSPLLEITCRQAQALEKALNRTQAGHYRVFVGMRHWRPYIREAVDQIAQAGITEITAICMTPFLSKMSTGAYYDRLQQAIEAQDPQGGWCSDLKLHKIGAWYSHSTFIQSQAANVQAGLKKFHQDEQPIVLFSAHSLPAALADQGDPYGAQFAQLCSEVAKSAGLQPGAWQQCYQSAGAQNTRWLGPSLEDTIHQLASEGKQAILVAPIGFLADHVEILYDIDIEAQQEATEAGIHLERTASPNDTPLFITALSEIIRNGEFSL